MNIKLIKFLNEEIENYNDYNDTNYWVAEEFVSRKIVENPELAIEYVNSDPADVVLWLQSPENIEEYVSIIHEFGFNKEVVDLNKIKEYIDQLLLELSGTLQV